MIRFSKHAKMPVFFRVNSVVCINSFTECNDKNDARLHPCPDDNVECGMVTDLGHVVFVVQNLVPHSNSTVYAVVFVYMVTMVIEYERRCFGPRLRAVRQFCC